MTVTHSVVLYDPTETSAEVKAAAGFLAGYSGRTREAYTLDLHQFYGWCDKHHLRLFEVTRTHIELSAREFDELGRAPATIGRRLSTLLVPSWSHRCLVRRLGRAPTVLDRSVGQEEAVRQA